MKFADALNDLLFPQRCIACGSLGISLCIRCRRGWSPRFYRNSFSHGKLSLVVHSSVPYSPIAQKIILAAKESGMKAADSLIVEALLFSVQQILLREQVEVLIPIPSRPSAARKRGRQFLDLITREVGGVLGIASESLLTHQRRVLDQSELDHRRRWNNLEGSLVLHGVAAKGVKALLIDDLVTTGATLLEGSRALTYAGIEVVGAATAAVVLTSKIM
jgi:predicted amidophosphoribosyltransferase